MTSPAVTGPPGFRRLLDRDPRFTRTASLVHACLTCAGGLAFAFGVWNAVEHVWYRLHR